MKRALTTALTLSLFFICGMTFSQETEVKIKKKTYSTVGKSYLCFRNTRSSFEGHLTGMGLGYSGLISNIGNFSLPDDARFMSQKGNSIAFDLIPYSYSIKLSRHVGFVTALGLEVNNFKFDNNISLTQDQNGYVVAKNYEKLDKSKLVTTYLTLPFLLEAQFGKYNNMFVNFGVIGAWKMQSHTKIIGHNDEVKGKYKNKKGLNISNFRYGYTAQIGYDKIGIYAKYYPDPIFKKSSGPRVSEINIGLFFYFNDIY